MLQHTKTDNFIEGPFRKRDTVDICLEEVQVRLISVVLIIGLTALD